MRDAAPMLTGVFVLAGHAAVVHLATHRPNHTTAPRPTPQDTTGAPLTAVLVEIEGESEPLSSLTSTDGPCAIDAVPLARRP